MTDKTAEFRRINEPRIERALAQLGHVEKSAKSLRIGPVDTWALVKPLATRLAVHKPGEGTPSGHRRSEPELQTLPYTPGERQAKAEIPPGTTPPVAREMSDLDRLSTQQLVDRMIACGAELAKRRQ